MRVQSREACSSWIAAHGLIESPYGRTDLPLGVSYTRAVAPEPRTAARPVLSAALAENAQGPALVVVCDWSRHSESALPVALQALGDELHPGTFEGAGMEFGTQESSCLLETIAYVFEAGMSAYLYLPGPDATVLLWEGEYMELWTRNPTTVTTARKTYAECGLQISIAR